MLSRPTTMIIHLLIYYCYYWTDLYSQPQFTVNSIYRRHTLHKQCYVISLLSFVCYQIRYSHVAFDLFRIIIIFCFCLMYNIIYIFFFVLFRSKYDVTSTIFISNPKYTIMLFRFCFCISPPLFPEPNVKTLKYSRIMVNSNTAKKKM